MTVTAPRGKAQPHYIRVVSHGSICTIGDSNHIAKLFRFYSQTRSITPAIEIMAYFKFKVVLGENRSTQVIVPNSFDHNESPLCQLDEHIFIDHSSPNCLKSICMKAIYRVMDPKKKGVDIVTVNALSLDTFTFYDSVV